MVLFKVTLTNFLTFEKGSYQLSFREIQDSPQYSHDIFLNRGEDSWKGYNDWMQTFVVLFGMSKKGGLFLHSPFSVRNLLVCIKS